MRPELVVDRDHDKTLGLNLDITFPNMPCDLLSMDIMDLTGDVQADILEGNFLRTRLDRDGKEIATDEPFKVNKEDGAKSELSTEDSQYCGSCYGGH